MKKILVAVDDTKGSLPTIETTARLFPCVKPETVVLVYVQKIEGRSLMDEVIQSESEMETLKESLKGTEHQDRLDAHAEKVMAYFVKALEEKGIRSVTPVVREGHPAEEILKVAEEEQVELIIVGSKGRRMNTIFMGSVSREVANSARAPVLIAR